MKKMKKLIAAVFAAIMALSLLNASLVASDAEDFTAHWTGEPSYEEVQAGVEAWLYERFGLNSISDILYTYGEEGMARLEAYSFLEELNFARQPRQIPCPICNMGIATQSRLEGAWSFTGYQRLCGRVAGAIESQHSRPVTIQNICGSCGVTNLNHFSEIGWLCHG